MAFNLYLKAEEITFTVEDTAEIQKVEMKDDVPTGTLLLNKEGEFLEDVSLMDSIGGWITHLFKYVTGSLKDVVFFLGQACFDYPVAVGCVVSFHGRRPPFFYALPFH